MDTARGPLLWPSEPNRIRLPGLRPRTRAAVLALHTELFRGTDTDRIAGKLRTTQSWIGDSDESPRRAEFIPPNELRVPDLHDDLCAFAARDDVPAVAQAAIVHAQ